MTNLEKSVIIARYFTHREIKNCLLNANTMSMKARYEKHESESTITRRNRNKEKAHGKSKSYISLLADSKIIKKSWSMEEVDEFIKPMDTNIIFSFVKELKETLRASYNKIEYGNKK